MLKHHWMTHFTWLVGTCIKYLKFLIIVNCFFLLNIHSWIYFFPKFYKLFLSQEMFNICCNISLNAFIYMYYRYLWKLENFDIFSWCSKPSMPIFKILCFVYWGFREFGLFHGPWKSVFRDWSFLHEFISLNLFPMCIHLLN